MNWIILFALIFIILEAVQAFIRCDSGNWEQVAPIDKSNHGSYARSPMTPVAEQKGEKEWESFACPSQALQYSCYYHEGNNNATDGKSRAYEVEYRRFKPSNAACLDFHPFDFLSAIKNRNILLLGDSVVNQVFQTLLCDLNSAVEGTVSMEWQGTNPQNRRLCPYGAKHCHPIHGFVNYRTPNATIRSVVAAIYKADMIRSVLSEHKPSKDDVLLVNFGLHYNEPHTLEASLSSLVQELYSLSQGHTVQLPHLLFMQTLPQHFPTSNGYWDNVKSPHSKACRPDIPGSIDDIIKRMDELDWRNKVADKIISEYNAKVKSECTSATAGARACNLIDIIYTARPIYSQFDAHIGFTPFFWFGHADCTHYCQPSAIFDVVHMAMYNALVDKLNMRQQIKSKSEFLLGQRSELLIKGSGKQVYLLKLDGRYAFTGLQSFVSRGYDFSDVVTYPDSIVDNIPVVGSLH
ncbi:hypothetical protein EON65_22520 [archaeon]|nr:MAG: hypothetical protein EON65_22520 [archaeon]